MKITKRERGLAAITISAVLLGLNYMLVIPLVHSWGEVGIKLSDRQHELEGVKTTIQRKGEWKKQYDDLKQGLGQKAGAFQQVSDVLKKIEEVATSSGVQVTSRRPMVEENKGVYRVLPVQCAVEATTDSLVHFLFALQSGAGFMSVEQLQISPRPENVGILRCEIQVRALAAKGGGPAS
jgi:Tfp pilus assembly protein PilO